ncbi:hypothetical protein AB4212_16615, partial [Streptomyces sp. 2MCAF27]
MTALDRGAAPGLDPIDEHVAALAGVLHGPVRVKERMLTEARDALTDAAADIAEGGSADGRAARQAVDDFGSVEDIAPAFQRELTIAQARYTARRVALIVPFWILSWYVLAIVDHGRGLPHAIEVLAAHVG